jgi:TolB-like protein/DNA-binding winged helix-turn-helix (wHTH) protein/Tfp pilus assembly protein PilF
MPEVPTQSSQCFYFGTFEVDLRLRELRKQGLKVKLQDKPLEVLALLLEQAGEIVTREDLRRRLWPSDTFVDFDANLNTTLNKLRRALGDSADNPRFIETLPRHGYRFIAPVEAVAAGTEPEVAAAETIPPQATSLVSAASPGRQGLWGWMRSRAATETAITLAVFASVLVTIRWAVVRQTRSATGKTMLLVLPFEDLSGDSGQEYFADGLTDEIITELGRLRPDRLGVIARTSAMQYKHTSKPLRDIARDVGVDYVLEGSVLRAGGAVRVTARLIQSSDQTELWTESYERATPDVLALQRDVVNRIAQSLAIELLPHGNAPENRAAAVNPEAYEAYLKGRYYWNKRTADGLEKGLGYFQQAIQIDPDYAQAYAGLAESYLVAAGWEDWMAPWREALPKAREAAKKALEIDSSLGSAHACLAYIIWEDEWDWRRAEEEFKRAIELDPGYATAHQWYAEFLTGMGRYEDALAESRTALKLDPLSLIINAEVGYVYYYARKYDETIDACRKTLEMDPNFPPAHVFLSWAYVQKGLTKQAVEERERALILDGMDKEQAAGFSRAYARGGLSAARRWALEQMRPQGSEYVTPYGAATLCAGLGERDQAFHWLEECYRRHDTSLRWIKVDPKLDPLRSDPRFDSLLQRLHLLP